MTHFFYFVIILDVEAWALYMTIRKVKPVNEEISVYGKSVKQIDSHFDWLKAGFLGAYWSSQVAIQRQTCCIFSILSLMF